MAIPKVELMWRRRVIRAFIEADGEHVQFIRAQMVDMGAGGFKAVDAPPLPPQLIRIIRGKRRYGPTTVNTEAGAITRYPYQILGLYNCDVQPDDKFILHTRVYQIKNIEPDREERTVMWAEEYGQGNVAAR